MPITQYELVRGSKKRTGDELIERDLERKNELGEARGEALWR